MKKLALKLDELRVESFATSLPDVTRGTVQAQSIDQTPNSGASWCVCATDWDCHSDETSCRTSPAVCYTRVGYTCDYDSCGGTCFDKSCGGTCYGQRTCGVLGVCIPLQ